MADDLELRCWPRLDCTRRVRFVLDNCTDEELTLGYFAGRGTGDGQAFAMEPNPRMAPRSRLELELPWAGVDYFMGVGRHQVQITEAERPDARRSRSAVVAFELVDPTKERERAACVRRGDDWDLRGWGLLRTESCEPVMPDAGRSCSDGRDCAGFCRLEGQAPVSPTAYRVWGRCTRHRTRFGCNTFVGDTDHGRVPASAHFPRMCVD